MKIEVRYASNGQKVGDAEFRITRVWENGTRFAVMTNEKTGHMAEVKFVPVEDEEPAPQPEPDPIPDPDPAPDPDPVPDPEPKFARYVVSTSGNDSGSGSPAAPFRTISRALRANVSPGDIIVVQPGIYRESVEITRGGSAAGNVRLKSETPGAAKINPSGGWNAVTVKANYVTIDGLEIFGASGDGIEANGVHHVEIRNCICHDNDESGIQTNYGDAFTIENNICHNNAASGHYSGISLYQNRPIGPAGTERYRNVIRGNTCYRNFTERGNHTDGNGIIVDDFRNTQNNSPAGNYPYWTLVEDNVCYENGGKGVQIFSADRVTVRGNTCYHNGLDPLDTGTWRGELSAAFADGVEFIDNMAVAKNIAGKRNYALLNTSSGSRNENVTWSGNYAFHDDGTSLVLTDGGNSIPAVGNALGVRPEFVDEAGRDFRIVED